MEPPRLNGLHVDLLVWRVTISPCDKPDEARGDIAEHARRLSQTLTKGRVEYSGVWIFYCGGVGIYKHNYREASLEWCGVSNDFIA